MIRTPGAELAERIKMELPARRVLEAYGYIPNRAGYVCCPFHLEKTPSLKVYEGEKSGWHCFGCGAGGTVVDFVMKLFNLSFHQAVLRLCFDFGLDAGAAAPNRSPEVRQRETERRREADQRMALEVEYRLLAEEHAEWWDVRKHFAPEGVEELRPIFCEALQRLPELEYRLDMLENQLRR